jgi:hypothetical protein
MPKVNIVLDTEAQSCDISIDGTKLDNVIEARISNYGYDGKSDYSANVTTYEESAGVRKITQYMASKSVEAQAALRDGVGTLSTKFKGFVEKISSTSLIEEVSKYFAK